MPRDGGTKVEGTRIRELLGRERRGREVFPLNDLMEEADAQICQPFQEMLPCILTQSTWFQ